MRLISPYAPPTFLKPVILVDTVYSSKERETAVLFVQALNSSHALATLSQTTPAESARILDSIHRGLAGLTEIERADCVRALIGLALSYNSDNFRKLEEITPGRVWRSEFIPVKIHASTEEAIAYHLELTKNFINGGSEEEWSQGWDGYLQLYDQFCPDEMKDPTELLLKKRQEEDH